MTLATFYDGELVEKAQLRVVQDERKVEVTPLVRRRREVAAD